MTAQLIDKLRVPVYAKDGCNASHAIATASSILPAWRSMAAGPSASAASLARSAPNAVQDLGSHIFHAACRVVRIIPRLFLETVSALFPRSMASAVGGHLSGLMRQMPEAVQRVVGDLGAPLMRRTRQLLLPASSDDTLRPGGHVDGLNQSGPRRQLWQVAGTAGAAGDEAAQGRASQGESWLLQDPFASDEDGEEVATILREYRALGHSCPLFARKFASTTARRLSDVVQQHILAPVL